jgi:hypothetical protein
MKRLILLAALGLATATTMPAMAGNFSSPNQQKDDTIIVKLANGAKMSLLLKNSAQLKTFQNYSLDSLMRTLDKYISDASKNSNSGKDYTVTYRPAEETKNQEAPEQITITFKGSESAIATKEEKRFTIKVDYDDKTDKTKFVAGSNPDAKKDSASVKKPVRYSRNSTNLELALGFNSLLNTDDNILGINDLRPWGSRFVSLGITDDFRIGGIKSPLSLRSGITFMFYNYMFDGNIQVRDEPVAGNDYTYFVEDNTLPLDKSKLAVTTINVPLMAILDFKNDSSDTNFRFGVGGFIGYRIGAHTKIKYNQDGHDRKDKDDGNFNLEDLQYGLKGIIGYRGTDLFVNYNLNELFKNNRGPKANAISFGVSWNI